MYYDFMLQRLPPKRAGAARVISYLTRCRQDGERGRASRVYTHTHTHTHTERERESERESVCVRERRERERASKTKLLGDHVLIIDDLVRTGGTLVACAEVPCSFPFVFVVCCLLFVVVSCCCELLL